MKLKVTELQGEKRQSYNHGEDSNHLNHIQKKTMMANIKKNRHNNYRGIINFSEKLKLVLILLIFLSDQNITFIDDSNSTNKQSS